MYIYIYIYLLEPKPYLKKNVTILNYLVQLILILIILQHTSFFYKFQMHENFL